MTRAAPFVCLDDSLSGRTLLFERPVEILSAWTPSEAWQALGRMEKLRQSGLELAGYFAYELGYLFEPRLAPLLPDNRQVPLIRFGAFETARAGDLPVALPAGGEERALVNRLVPSWSLPAYALRFERVRDYIAAGDVYQINLTFPLDGVLDGDPLDSIASSGSASRWRMAAWWRSGPRPSCRCRPSCSSSLKAGWSAAGR